MRKNPKIIMLGDSGAGKTSIIQSLINGPESLKSKPATTFGASFHVYKTPTGRSFEIWDTAGQEQYRSLLHMYFRNCNGVILVYDLSDNQSVRAVEYWLGVLENTCENSPQIIIVGNKADIAPQLKDQSLLTRLVKSNPKTKHMQCSAKTGNNIQEMFTTMSRMIKIPSETGRDRIIVESKTMPTKNKKKNCC